LFKSILDELCLIFSNLVILLFATATAVGLVQLIADFLLPPYLCSISCTSCTGLLLLLVSKWIWSVFLMNWDHLTLLWLRSATNWRRYYV